MILKKGDFIQQYINKLNHKIIQELECVLTEEGFFSDFIKIANETVHNLTKEV